MSLAGCQYLQEDRSERDDRWAERLRTSGDQAPGCEQYHQRDLHPLLQGSKFRIHRYAVSQTKPKQHHGRYRDPATLGYYLN